MAGILNKRNRFVDLLITQEGKRQLFDGKLKAEFASVSDKNTYYDKSRGSIDPNDNAHFNLESYSLETDSIVLETDDSGRLVLPPGSTEFSVVGNKIFDLQAGKSSKSLEEKLRYRIINSASFSSAVNNIKNISIDNFKKNSFLSTKAVDPAFDDFQLTEEGKKSNHTFVISNSVPFKYGTLTEEVFIDDAEPFMFDSKISHYKNFSFLPPINKNGSNLGNYSDFRSTSKQTLSQIKQSLNIQNLDFNPVDQEGIAVNYIGDTRVINRANNQDVDLSIAKEFKKIKFTKTSQFNNVILQVYEKDKENKTLIKLDIVNAGVFIDDDATVNVNKNIYYVGKVYFDSNNIPTFVNIFTLIFD